MANAQRRTELLDAAIEVLAQKGARGLTFRAVDAVAEVPVGTASNYFASRDDLLVQAGGRVYQRLAPDEETMARSLGGPRDQQRVRELARDVARRVGEYRVGHLALLELRLEATRRPPLQEVLTRTVREDLEANISYHLDSGLPGDAATVVLMHLALNWLVLERLTLPGVLDGVGGFSEVDLVNTLIQRISNATAEASPARHRPG